MNLYLSEITLKYIRRCKQKHLCFMVAGLVPMWNVSVNNDTAGLSLLNMQVANVVCAARADSCGEHETRTHTKRIKTEANTTNNNIWNSEEAPSRMWPTPMINCAGGLESYHWCTAVLQSSRGSLWIAAGSLWICKLFQHFIDMLSTDCQHCINTLSTLYQHFIRIS